MSYWNVPDADYHELAVATPGWQSAPVPGWGINPLRAGPMRVGLGGGIPGEDNFLPRWTALGADPEDAYKETSWGVVAGAAALGIGLGILFGYARWGRRKALTPNARKRRSGPSGRAVRGILHQIEEDDRKGRNKRWARIQRKQARRRRSMTKNKGRGGAFAKSGIKALKAPFDPVTGKEFRTPHVRMSSGVVYPDTKSGVRRAINDLNRGAY